MTLLVFHLWDMEDDRAHMIVVAEDELSARLLAQEFDRGPEDTRWLFRDVTGIEIVDQTKSGVVLHAYW